jgi:ATP-dependent Lon protease
MPKWNKKDLEDLPAKVRRDIVFHFVDNMMEVLHIALEKAPEKSGKQKNGEKLNGDCNPE